MVKKMRKVPLEYIRDGHINARALYNESGQLLIGENLKLTENYLLRLKRAGYTSLYIQDEYCEQEIEEVIKPKILNQLNVITQNIAKLVVSSDSVTSGIQTKNGVEKCVQDFSKIIDEIIFDLMHNKEVLNNLISVSVYDDYTFQHSLNIMTLAMAIGGASNLNLNDLKTLAIGAMFHDIGKLFIPKQILNKNGKLTNEEFNVVKEHPKNGFDFLRDFSEMSVKTRIIAIEHHEKWDGTGYPNNKAGEEISLMGRICAVCDVFEALIADRPYRKALPVSEAREYVLGGGGSAFDINIVQTFSNTINPYPLDTRVRLSDGREGVVVGIKPGFVTRPQVKIHCEENRKTSPYTCDLMIHHNIIIQDIIHEFSFENNEKTQTFSKTISYPVVAANLG